MFVALEVLFILLLVFILAMLCKDDRALSKMRRPRARIDECWNGKERRKHTRFNKALDITYALEKKPHIKSSAKTSDVSEGGVRLILDKKLAKDSLICMKIELPGLAHAIEVEGKVAWTNECEEKDESGKRFFCAGVTFTAADKHHGKQFVNYVRSLAPTPEQ